MTKAQKGTVYLVGAGPGDPELLTLKAVRLLATGDVVLHDGLVPQAILDYANNAQIVDVGKRCGSRGRISQDQIHSLMIAEARKGSSVVRLKSGDPLVFGRAGEEIEALEEAGIPFEIVSGVTAMFAAAAAARKSLTDRRSASKVILTTAHHAPDKAGHTVLWRGTLPNDATLGIYMPGRDLDALAWDLLAAGMPAELPCIVISHISLPDQKIHPATLGNLGELRPDASPVFVLAGWPLATEAEQIVPGVLASEWTESVQKLP
jgi:uroporphyrin-III C-methyltransferase